MLNADVKNRINYLRDILVGKVPDPKTQIDQITTALIYKFMSDSDDDCVDNLKGKRTYFIKSLKNYSWKKIMDSTLENDQRLRLYKEALSKIPKAKHINSFFKDIFKNAFLPYNDPDTLTLFLKKINEFQYINSEDLGNGFEYLLSILGSQGDAGQFRTPRHIIDFIVEVLEPQKKEAILDPACGTSGFLISAYKHMIKKESSNYNPNEDKPSFMRKEADAPSVQIQSNGKYKGDEYLDWEGVQKKIFGYDISPDMVKFSKVNLFLHNFKRPNIFPHDTISKPKYWDKEFDLILANPPFMTPVGGIVPLKNKFINSNRSEVLFVDYIKKHLAKGGRAGIIVPEGIIFKANNVYKELRKSLVCDGYLHSVVSLPSGVFQPYSGVKTSILFLNRKMDKKSEILFIDIKADSYELGVNRRFTNENDLPEAYKILKDWMCGKKRKSKKVAQYWIKKKEILEKNDVSLSFNQYVEEEVKSSKYPMVKLGEVCEKIKYPDKIKKSEYLATGRYPIISQEDEFISGYSNNEQFLYKNIPVTIFGDHTRCVKYISFPFCLGADGVKVLKPDGRFHPKFFYYFVKKLNVRSMGYSRHFKLLKDKEIPLPPLEEQKKIVEELDGYQKIIDGAKQVVENWRPTLETSSKKELFDLGKIVYIKGRIGWKGLKKSEYLNEGYAIINGHQILTDGVLWENVGRVSKERYEESPEIMIKQGDILMTKDGTIGKVSLVSELPEPATVASGVFVIRKISNKINQKYLFYYFQSILFKKFIKSMKKGAVISHLYQKDLASMKISLPSPKKQKEIVAKIEKEKKTIDLCKQLIQINEQKLKERVDRLFK